MAPKIAPGGAKIAPGGLPGAKTAPSTNLETLFSEKMRPKWPLAGPGLVPGGARGRRTYEGSENPYAFFV